jgi:hypothetical protein
VTCGGYSGAGNGFCPSTFTKPSQYNPPMPHTHHHINATEEKTRGKNFYPSNIAILFWIFGNIGDKSAFTLFLVLESMYGNCVIVIRVQFI